MGVSYYNCDSCEEIFSDVGRYKYCEDGHYYCSDCIEDDFKYDEDEGYITNCKLCEQEELRHQEEEEKKEYEKNCFHIEFIISVLEDTDMSSKDIESFVSKLYERKSKKEQ